MAKTVKIVIALIFVAVAGFFVYNEFGKTAPQDADLETLKESIIAEPKVAKADLTDEQKNKYLEAFKKAREEIIKANFDSLNGVNDIALLKQYLGDYEGAIDAWQYANIIRPQNSLSFSNLAALYHFDLHEYDKAEKNYLISIANDPDDILTIRNLYELYFDALKDNAKAEALLLDAIENNPTVADLYALTGSFYQQTGNKEKAVEYYKKHLELNPNNEAVRRELQNLQS